MINPYYKDAHSLLETTTNGYVFLQLLLQQVHTTLIIETVAVQDIQKYSTTKNLYSYTKNVALFVSNNTVQKRHYSNK